MNIGINCRSFLKAQSTGIGRYTAHLVRELGRVDQRNTYDLYAPVRFFDRRRKPPQIPGPNFRIRLDRFQSGPASILKDCDVYHAPSLEDIEKGHNRVVVTVHDLVYKIFPEVHTSATRAASQRQLESIVGRADRIICCSNRTADDLTQYFPVAGPKVRVVYQGVDGETFFPVCRGEKALAAAVRAKYHVRRPYFLFVGTLEPRKNLVNVLAAFSELRTRRPDLRLVIVGMRGWMGQEPEDLVARYGLSDAVIMTGYVPDTDLRFLYGGAEALVFPSFYEGFGFPIVEAFRCGTPVITSEGSSCEEIAGDAAAVVDPSSVDAIAGAMHRILTDEHWRRGLITAGLRWGMNFSTARNAAATLAVYEELAPARARAGIRIRGLKDRKNGVVSHNLFSDSML